MRIVICEFMDEAAVATLAARFDVAVRPQPGRPARRTAAASSSDADALIVRNRTQVDAALLAAAPVLKVVGRLGVGLDNIDTAACAARGIEVIPGHRRQRAGGGRVRGRHRDAAAARRVSVLDGSGGRRVAAYRAVGRPRDRRQDARADRLRRHRPPHRTARPRARHARDRLRSAVAGVVAAVGGRRRRARGRWTNCCAKPTSCRCTCRSRRDTRNLLDAARIAAMKPEAILINTARGGVVDESAVAAALRAGHLGGAALDVFDQEPLPAGTDLAGCPNLLLTPHIAGVTRESNVRVSSVIAQKVAAALDARVASVGARVARDAPAPRSGTRSSPVAPPTSPTLPHPKIAMPDSPSTKSARSPIARCATPAPARRWRRPPRPRWPMRKRRACRRTACRASGSTRRTCATAAPTARRCPRSCAARAVRCSSMPASGLAFPACAFAVTEAIARAREFGVAFVGVTNSHHFGVAAYHLTPVAEAGMVGVALGNSPGAMPAAGGKRADLRHQSDRGDLSAPRRAAADDRHVAVGSGARQADGRGQGGPVDSARLGARQGGQSDDRSQGRHGGPDAAGGRHQGRDAGADRRAAGVRAHRRRDGLRGRHVLRRCGQPAAHRPGVPRDRSRRARGPATPISSASKR